MRNHSTSAGPIFKRFLPWQYHNLWRGSLLSQTKLCSGVFWIIAVTAKSELFYKARRTSAAVSALKCLMVSVKNGLHMCIFFTSRFYSSIFTIGWWLSSAPWKAWWWNLVPRFIVVDITRQVLGFKDTPRPVFALWHYFLSLRGIPVCYNISTRPKIFSMRNLIHIILYQYLIAASERWQVSSFLLWVSCQLHYHFPLYPHSIGIPPLKLHYSWGRGIYN